MGLEREQQRGRRRIPPRRRPDRGSPCCWAPRRSPSTALGDLDRTATGNALTAFRNGGGAFAAGFDGGGPRFSAFALPAGGSVGQALASPPPPTTTGRRVATISWLFGDGTGAPGAIDLARLRRPRRSYTATATATDAIDNVTGSPGP